jgi:hypothetical protein
LPSGGRVEIESAWGHSVLGGLLKEMLRDSLVDAPARRCLLISVRTKPEARGRLAELLREGTPFDPFATSVTRHDVFVLDNQVLFSFEVDDGVESDDAFAGAWRWAEAWSEVVVEVRNAEWVFTWARPASPARSVSGVGLGY